MKIIIGKWFKEESYYFYAINKNEHIVISFNYNAVELYKTGELVLGQKLPPFIKEVEPIQSNKLNIILITGIFTKLKDERSKG